MSVVYYPEVLASAIADGPTLTAAAAASCLHTGAVASLPPNYFDRPGKQLWIKAHGRISSVITTPGTARFDVRLGGTVVWDSLAILLDTVAAHVNVPWWLDIELTCRSIGSGILATLIGNARWTCEDILGTPATAPKGSLTAILPWNTAPVVGAGFNSQGLLTVDMFFTQTVATGSLTVHQSTTLSPN